MISPYLLFHGGCAEALDFYEGVFAAGDKKSLPYGDYRPENAPEGVDVSGWVMHAEMTIGGTKCWFADEMTPIERGSGFSLSVTVETTEEARAIFDRLADGGTVTLPPTATFYSELHGAVRDRFGVLWQIVSEEAPK